MKTFGKALVRVSIAVALAFLVGWLKKGSEKPWRESAGKVIACGSETPFGGRPAEILSYGFADPRGVAFDATRGQVLIVDAGRRDVLAYSVEAGKMQPPQGTMCPEGPCELIDQRGLAFRSDRVFVAEHQRGRISQWLPGAPGPLPETGINSFYAPSGVAVDEMRQQVLVADADNLFSAPLEHPNQGAQLIAAKLHHPSGLALSPAGDMLYLSEANEDETRWITYVRSAETWTRKGVLAVEKNLDRTVLAFQGIATHKRWIFAAGPGGLHAFNPEGASVGRVEFYGRVSGVASGKNKEGHPCLYFTVGHTLCSIEISD